MIDQSVIQQLLGQQAPGMGPMLDPTSMGMASMGMPMQGPQDMGPIPMDMAQDPMGMAQDPASMGIPGMQPMGQLGGPAPVDLGSDPLESMFSTNPISFDDMLPPFPSAVVEPKAPPKPSLQAVINDALDIEEFYRPQKERMYLDDKLYQMDDPYRNDRVKADEGTEDEGEFAPLNDLRVIADKFGNRIGRTEPHIRVPGRDVDDTADAQEIENYLRWTWKLWSQRHTLCGGKMPLLRQEVMSAAVRGWVCYRVWYDPEDEEAPFQLSLFDPQFVYPYFDPRKGIKKVLVIRDMTLGEVLDAYPEFADDVEAEYRNSLTGELDRTWWVSTIAYYDTYYHGFIMQNKWVKEPAPHGMGCCPWVCVPNQGGIFEAAFGEGSSNEWTRYYGDSIYASLRDPFKVMVRLYSALMTQVGKDANQPVIIATRNGQIQASDISTGIGAVSVINDPDAKILPIAQTQRPGLIETVVQGVKTSMSKGAMPDIVWGQDMNTQSGLARSILHASAEDVFSPIIVSIQIARAAVSEIVLKVVKKHEITAPMVSMRKGQLIQGQWFSFESVINNGTYVEFSFKDLTPQDMVALGALVVNLVRAGIISMETSLGDKFLALDDPQLETERKIKERGLFDPRVMEILLDFVMTKNPNDPLAIAWTQKKTEEKMMALMGGQPNSPQQGHTIGDPMAGGQREGQMGTNTIPRQTMRGANPTLDMAAMANADMNTQG
jgi:hypothetical protein